MKILKDNKENTKINYKDAFSTCIWFDIYCKNISLKCNGHMDISEGLYF